MATMNVAVISFDRLKLHGGAGTLFVEAQAGLTADTMKPYGLMGLTIIISFCVAGMIHLMVVLLEMHSKKKS